VLPGLLIPLLALEVFLRVAGPLMPGEYQTASFVETHPQFGRRNRPGEGWKRTSEYTSWISVNSKGLRGPEIEYAKPPGEVRVLMIGDSFTFAEQVNQHETFAYRLEQQLNAAGASRQYGVLNGGSNGWATANELIYLALEGVRYQPDLVVVALYVGNDVTDNYRRVGAVREAERADLALRGVDTLEGPRRWLRKSMVYTWFESGVLAKLPSTAPADASEAAMRPGPRTPEQSQEAWEISAGLLQRMKQVTESQGARLVVMAIPSADQLTAGPRATEPGEEMDPDDADDVPGFENPQASLSEITDRLGLPMLDLLPTFRVQAERSRQRLFYRVNAHWTAAGHALAAQELHEFLVQMGAIP